MTRLTESAIEELAIQLFEQLGYTYIYAPDIAPDKVNGEAREGARGHGDRPERSRYDEVILNERLSTAVRRINPTVPHHALQEAVKEVERIHSPELLANNEAFHRMMAEGVKANYQKDGQDRGDLVWLIDFVKPENNEFVVANQFTVIENNQNKRPDIVLFVNGLPLVVIELKNAVDENATIKSAYQQLNTYKHTIPSLFTYNAISTSFPRSSAHRYTQMPARRRHPGITGIQMPWMAMSKLATRNCLMTSIHILRCETGVE